MEFAKSLKLHLDAIKNKNLDIFLSTVNNKEVMLIMPNGTLINNEKDFLEFHKDWFLDEDWNLYYEIIKIDEANDIAYAIIDVDYRDCDEAGKEILMNYYLNLIFKKYDEKWLLVFDQNTIHK